MSAIVVYESIYGNTRAVAEAIAEGGTRLAGEIRARGGAVAEVAR
jgi:flavodoxin